MAIPRFAKGQNDGVFERYIQTQNNWQVLYSPFNEKAVNLKDNPYNHQVRFFLAALYYYDWHVINHETKKSYQAI